jgi:hypothetical protein
MHGRYPVSNVSPHCATSWQPPPAGFVKLNWDAAVDEKRCKMGIGIVVRNSSGEVLAILFTKREHFYAGNC